MSRSERHGTRHGWARSLSLGSVFVAAACTIAEIDFTGRRCPCVEGYECVSGLCVKPGAMDASSSDSALDQTAEDAATCIPRRPPPRPENAVDEPRISFLTALKRMDHAPPPTFDFPFFDQDGVCTECGKPATASCSGANEVCDEPNGVDRSLNSVLTLLFNQTSNADFTTGLLAGRTGMLIAVNDYNGLPDDTFVSVDFYFSAGLEGSASPPKFDGTDVYTVLPSSVDNGEPRWRAFGYVSSGRLVATIDKPIDFDVQLAFPIAHTLLVADIAESNGKRWLSRGTWGGRVESGALLTQMARLSMNGAALCDSPSALDAIKQLICSRADISATSPTPPGATPRCNALSFANAIEGAPAAGLGEVFDGPRPPPRCDAGFQVSCD